MKVTTGPTTALSLALVSGLAFGCATAERTMPGTMSKANVVALLNTIDTNEIEAAQLAQQKAVSPDVRAYATRLIEEHTGMVTKNQEVARRMNIEPDQPHIASSLNNAHQGTMDNLRIKSGAEFDQTYLDYQIRMHERAVSLVEDHADSAEEARLRRHLLQARPDLLSHLAEARSIQQQMVVGHQVE